MSTVQVNLLQNYQSVVIVFIAIEMFGSVGIDNKSSVYVCGGYMVCQDGACYSQSVAVLGGSGLTGVWCGVYSGDTAQSTINLTPTHSDTDILHSHSSSSPSSPSSVCQLLGTQLTDFNKASSHLKQPSDK